MVLPPSRLPRRSLSPGPLTLFHQDDWDSASSYDFLGSSLSQALAIIMTILVEHIETSCAKIFPCVIQLILFSQLPYEMVLLLSPPYHRRCNSGSE